jgi:hypothetical protein
MHTRLQSDDEPMATYRIVRFYAHRRSQRKKLPTGLTLAEAQAHCADPETSSRTCASYQGRMRTKIQGPWFDGYEEEE